MNQNNVKHIWIFAGGTGGHISPAISLADAFSKKKVSFIFFTLPKNLDYPGLAKMPASQVKKVVDYPALPIPKNLFALFKFLKSCHLAWKVFQQKNKKEPASAVIAMGGYPCFTPLLWALFKRIPYYLCEQNAALGKIHRIFSRFARVVFLSFPVPDMKKNYVFSGNPLRKDFQLQMKKSTKSSSYSAASSFSSASFKNSTLLVKKILLLGGSQGASDINELYFAMTQRPVFKNMVFTVAAGKNKFSTIKLKAEALSKRNPARKKDKMVEFIKDMHSAFSLNDLIITRAGSSTVFEIMSSRKPAIFLPYPYATNDHQRQNAVYLEKQGLAKIIDIRPFEVEKAVKMIEDILLSGELKLAQKNLLKHKIPLNAHKTISDVILRGLKNLVNKKMNSQQL